MSISIDEIITATLLAMFKDNIFDDKIYLKGGQALRIKEKLTSRFSADIDFSVPGAIQNPDDLFSKLKGALYAEFQSKGLHIFDFDYYKKPKVKKDGSPDFWSGWGMEFKLIQDSKKTLALDTMRRQALLPEGCVSTKITIDVSEYEYCGSVEKLKIGSVEIATYSRALLLLEKIRAICQQHSSYELKGVDSRARDFYDIEKLWQKVLKDKKHLTFIKECKIHIPHVFSSKNVPLELMDKIFEPDFLEIQKSGWETVKSTVSERIDSFDYYVENLREIIRLIQT